METNLYERGRYLMNMRKNAWKITICIAVLALFAATIPFSVMISRAVLRSVLYAL